MKERCYSSLDTHSQNRTFRASLLTANKFARNFVLFMNGRPPRHVDSQNPHASMGFHESAMTCELLNHIFTILSIASLVFSALPNAVRRKYPSPLGPKPLPGVPTTFASERR